MGATTSTQGRFSVGDSFLAGQTRSGRAELCGIGVGAKGQQGSGDGADLHPGQSSEVYLMQDFAPSKMSSAILRKDFSEHSPRYT